MIFYGILTSSLVAAFYAAVTFFAMLRLLTLFHSFIRLFAPFYSPFYSFSFAFFLLFIHLFTPFHSPPYSFSFASLLSSVWFSRLFPRALCCLSAA